MNYIRKLVGKIVKHRIIVLSLFLILCLIVPLFVFLFYDVFPKVIVTQISADGMLGYIGAVLGSAVSLSVAVAAFYREEKQKEEDEELQIEKRRNEIRADLYIELYLNEDNYFDVTITNLSNNIASDIYFIDRNVLPFLYGKQSQTVKVCFDFEVDIKDAYYFDFETEDGYPNEILLVYSDIEKNIISVQYNHYKEFDKHLYIAMQPEYVG